MTDIRISDIRLKYRSIANKVDNTWIKGNGDQKVTIAEIDTFIAAAEEGLRTHGGERYKFDGHFGYIEPADVDTAKGLKKAIEDGSYAASEGTRLWDRFF